MDDIVKDFLTESAENLDRLDQELVELESDPGSKELLSSIFRTIHTIKGTCGFLGFARLEKLAHAGESLLSRLREGEIQLNQEITTGLLAMVDAVRRMLEAIKSTGQDGEESYEVLAEHLSKLQNVTGEVPGGSRPEALKAEADSGISPVLANAEEELADPGKLGGLLLQRGQVRVEDLARALEQQELGRKRIGEILIAQGAAHPEDVLAAQQLLESKNPQSAVDSVRVSVSLLDRLMTLVGELVLARNQLLPFANSLPGPGLQAVTQRISLIATDLQEEVTKTRMQPIGALWSKFPRTVRDLALSCGKNVRLELEGQDTELDRTIIEAIKDPLTHLVRNAIDHGIEQPEIRKAAGKDAAGILKIRAFHDGGQVNIEISDDGGGLDAERIRQKAVARGIATAEHAKQMSDSEVFNLIFLPGLSTAEKVTNVSGRGVGMDVVKTNVEKIGGTVEVQSSEGKGTLVSVKMPLTLAIIPALMVTAGGERFAIPQASLLELVRVGNTASGRKIETVQGAAVYRLRERLLPLVSLRKELRLSPDSALGQNMSTQSTMSQIISSQSKDGVTTVVVVKADGREFGIVVDEILETEEIVVKPMGKSLKDIGVYSGATIMGDGRVALILDIVGLAHRAQVISEESASTASRREDRPAESNRKPGSGDRLLLVQCGRQRRLGIPLSLVTRIEEFPATALEFAGEQEVTQYRGKIMPLIRVSGIFAGKIHDSPQAETSDKNETLKVVIYCEPGRSVGLVVDDVIDIVEQELPEKEITPRWGMMGSSIVQDRVTGLLDVPAVVRHALPDSADAGPPM